MRDYSKRFPLPKTNIWAELPDRVVKLEEAVKTIPTIEAPKYKVFTALLTQNGGDYPYSISATSLLPGVTYQIQDNDHETADFTLAGAPNNNVGTSFIATSDTVNWGTNASGVLSYNEGAPLAIVLENTIGNIWFEYKNTGEYVCHSDYLFLNNKTTISIDSFGQNGNIPGTTVGNTTDNSEDKFAIITDKGGFIDNILQKTRLEIKVYN